VTSTFIGHQKTEISLGWSCWNVSF